MWWIQNKILIFYQQQVNKLHFSIQHIPINSAFNSVDTWQFSKCQILFTPSILPSTTFTWKSFSLSLSIILNPCHFVFSLFLFSKSNLVTVDAASGFLSDVQHVPTAAHTHPHTYIHAYTKQTYKHTIWYKTHIIQFMHNSSHLIFTYTRK